MAYIGFVQIHTPETSGNLFNILDISIDANRDYRMTYYNQNGGASLTRYFPGVYIKFAGYESIYNYRIRIDVGGVARYYVPFVPSSGAIITLANPTISIPQGSSVTAYIERELKNAAPTTPGAFISPVAGTVLKGGENATIQWGVSTDADGDAVTYDLEVKYNEQAYQVLNSYNTNAVGMAVATNLNKIQWRVRAKDNKGATSPYRESPSFTVVQNTVPTILLNTPNNKTLYENDTFIMEGSATDTDVNDILNVKYQIGSGEIRPIDTAISKGVAIPYRKVLTFKSGILYEDGKPITDTLSDGSPYTLRVWAEDDQGGKSTVEERIFFVVPNRPPALSIEPFSDQSGLINPDTISISGASSDPDGNDVVVKYRINEQAAVQIHSGPAGPWSFDVALKLLKDGENNIVVEVTDTHNFKSSKTIKLNKTVNLTSLSKSVQRYTIVPPAGTAQGVLLWLERDGTQPVTVEISMTNGIEQEQFKPMTLDSSGSANVGIVEDFFKFRADVQAEKIAIKLSWTGDKPIFKVSGALTQ